MNPFSAVVAAFAAFLIAVGPSAVADTKIVDLVRGLVDQQNKMASWVWIALATIVGVGMALAFQLNFVAPILVAIPALAGNATRLTGAWGQTLTGLGIAGSSSYWHHVLALKAARTAEAQSKSTTAG